MSLVSKGIIFFVLQKEKESVLANFMSKIKKF